MDAEKTGKLIRELRTEKKLTQQELASLLKVSPTAVSKWENGRSLPDISMLEPLVKVLEVSFAEIILGERMPRAADEESMMNKEETENLTSREERAEAAIKSVIDEQVSQKQKTGRRTTLAVAAAMLLLALGMILLARFSILDSKNRYTHDLSQLENVYDPDPEAPCTVGGKLYQQYLLINGEGFEDLLAALNVSSPEKLGEVVAYRPATVGEGCYYYCRIDALEGDWLLMFIEDGTGVPSANSALYLCGTKESIENPPETLQSLRGHEGVYYDRSKSANRYTVVYDYEAKPSDHLYIYAIEDEAIREALVASYRVAGKIAALIPIHAPEHPQYKGEESRILALIRAHNTNISGAVYIDTDPKTGQIIHSGLDQDIDWEGIAGYTSPEAPMYLYYEGFQSFAIIGDRAYCLTLKDSRAIEKTDNFVPYPGGEVRDILIPGNN